jgi:hypothetical protein
LNPIDQKKWGRYGQQKQAQGGRRFNAVQATLIRKQRPQTEAKASKNCL